MRMWFFLLVCACMFQPLAAKAANGVAVRSFTPQTSSVARGAQRVRFLRLAFHASCEQDVRIRSLKLYHEGLGSPADLLHVYALRGAERVSRPAASIGRDGFLTLRFSSLSIARCADTAIDIAADIAPHAEPAGEHRIVLRSLKDIVADAEATGSISQATGTVRTVGPAQTTVSATMLPPSRFPTYGAGRAVARLRLLSQGGDDMLITAITLTNDGSARDADLENLVLLSSDGRRVSDVHAQMDSERVRFVLDPPLALGAHADRLLTLRADVRASRRKTIDFLVGETSDIELEPAHRR